NLDREAARASALHGRAGESPDRLDSSDDDSTAGQGRFRPLQIRLRTTPNSPVRLSLTIRQPGISRDEVIASLEAFLAQLRSGDLDERLAPATHPERQEKPRK
ncbi:MAG: hypothetical protein MUO25_02425, partial [Thermoanaerobaculaceae bacterium]|nr:hypothetical protein [Thermoanaerobaculaceae bacterium]